ncbi:MAG: hypothetical protein LBJ80_01815 [Rickettsiales bacterium]|jgi:hypothetical protein|nr:hypothetical protein [Rickettsiales bacterium]MDR1261143.1 hypothetical protein [Rickettsiales bacterium]
MTVQTQNQNSPSIWEWKNTAHIAKAGLQASFAIAAIAIAATTIYAAAKGIALSSVLPAFLANPWVIATIAVVAAAYLIATAISSYQQMYSMEGAKGQDGTPGVNGNNADFSALLGDAVKGGDIFVKDNALFLKLSKEDYNTLTQGKNADDEVILYVLSIKDGAPEAVLVKFSYVKDANDGNNYKVELTSTTDKKAFRMADNATSLEVAVSNENPEALKNKVSAKLADVAVDAAITKVTGK